MMWRAWSVVMGRKARRAEILRFAQGDARVGAGLRWTPGAGGVRAGSGFVAEPGGAAIVDAGAGDAVV